MLHELSCKYAKLYKIKIKLKFALKKKLFWGILDINRNVTPV